MRVRLFAVILPLLIVLFGILSTPVFAASVSISGKITDSSGGAIVAASVNVTDYITNTSVGSTTTDNSGNYYLSILSGGIFNIQALPQAGSNFYPAQALNQNISADTVLNFVFVPVGTALTLSGHIFDSLGNPLNYQTVQLGNSSTTTDGSGSYSLQAAAGNYQLVIRSSGSREFQHNVPVSYIISADYSLNQNTTLDITIPASTVVVQVKDPVGNPVSNAFVFVANPAVNNITLGGGLTSTSVTNYGTSGFTDSSGNVNLWFFPGRYDFYVQPPSGSIYASSVLHSIMIVGNQREIISLQYSHATPVTTATLSPSPDNQGNYSDPTRVTLTAISAAGYSVTSIGYTIDGGSLQMYSSPFIVSGDGGHIITYRSIDNVGATESLNTKNFTIHANQPPVVGSLSNVIVNEGDTYSVNGSFSDTGSTSWTATVDYGDGTGSQPLTLSGEVFTLSHIYKDNGSYTVTVSVTDNQGASGTTNAVITVNNVAPTINTISVPSSIGLNNLFTVSANFTDLGVLDTHTASWDWGDGNTIVGTVSESNGSGSVSNSHSYTTPGVYTITLTLTDKDNGSGQSSTNITVVRQLTALNPAQVWIGLKNSDDVGVKFDLLAEVYKDSTLVSSGELDSVGGGSGFNNAHLDSIPFNSFSPVDFPAGSSLKIEVYVRNACSGSGHNSGTARLWFNDNVANSQFGATISPITNNYFLQDNFVLGTSAGSGPKNTIDVAAGAKCSAFKSFGTWTIIP